MECLPRYFLLGSCIAETLPFDHFSISLGGLKSCISSCIFGMRHDSPAAATASTRATEYRGPLEILDRNLIHPARKCRAGAHRRRSMLAVITKYGLVIQFKPGAVIGQYTEPVSARLFDIDFPGILNSKPLIPVRDSRETLRKALRPYIQRACIYRTYGS